MGLLVDLYQPSLPWRLTVEDGVGWDISDTFLNCAKEVSIWLDVFLRVAKSVPILLGDIELLVQSD